MSSSSSSVITDLDSNKEVIYLTAREMMNKLKSEGEEIIIKFFGTENYLTKEELDFLMEILYYILIQVSTINSCEKFINYPISTCGYFLSKINIKNLRQLLKTVLSEFINIKDLKISDDNQHIVVTIKR
jgi:hypothetical protein